MPSFLAPPHQSLQLLANQANALTLRFQSFFDIVLPSRMAQMAPEFAQDKLKRNIMSHTPQVYHYHPALSKSDGVNDAQTSLKDHR